MTDSSRIHITTDDPSPFRDDPPPDYDAAWQDGFISGLVVGALLAVIILGIVAGIVLALV